MTYQWDEERIHQERESMKADELEERLADERESEEE